MCRVVVSVQLCNAISYACLSDILSGYGGGFNERENVEYIEREESDGEYDEVCPSSWCIFVNECAYCCYSVTIMPPHFLAAIRSFLESSL